MAGESGSTPEGTLPLIVSFELDDLLKIRRNGWGVSRHGPAGPEGQSSRVILDGHVFVSVVIYAFHDGYS
jgi:hypothetical protein